MYNTLILKLSSNRACFLPRQIWFCVELSRVALLRGTTARARSPSPRPHGRFGQKGVCAPLPQQPEHNPAAAPANQARSWVVIEDQVFPLIYLWVVRLATFAQPKTVCCRCWVGFAISLVCGCILNSVNFFFYSTRGGQSSISLGQAGAMVGQLGWTLWAAEWDNEVWVGFLFPFPKAHISFT